MNYLLKIEISHPCHEKSCLQKEKAKQVLTIQFNFFGIHDEFINLTITHQLIIIVALMRVN